MLARVNESIISHRREVKTSVARSLIDERKEMANGVIFLTKPLQNLRIALTLTRYATGEPKKRIGSQRMKGLQSNDIHPESINCH